jgi:hypothetical protein
MLNIVKWVVGSMSQWYIQSQHVYPKLHEHEYYLIISWPQLGIYGTLFWNHNYMALHSFYEYDAMMLLCICVKLDAFIVRNLQQT